MTSKITMEPSEGKTTITVAPQEAPIDIDEKESMYAALERARKVKDEARNT